MATEIEKPISAINQTSSPITVVHVASSSPPDIAVSPYLQFGGPYAAGLAAVIAASLAATIAWRGINSARDNLVRQLAAQREISARTSRASVVSANRQKWIDALREDLASFLAADFALLDDNDVDEDDLTEVEKSKLDDRVRDAMQLRRLMQRRIQLRLNPDKPRHKALYKDVCLLLPATGSDHRKIRVRLIKTAQSFLREEWLRIKKEAGDWEEAVAEQPLTDKPTAEKPSWLRTFCSWFGRATQRQEMAETGSKDQSGSST